MSEQKINLEKYELPPQPPEGAFDIRFSSGRSLEAVADGKSEEFPILISSADYPLTFVWEPQTPSITASLKVGNKEISLSENAFTSVADPQSRIILKLTATSDLPTEYALDQNYPNPFNPNTTIRYQLPADSRVTLKMFNILGQEVKRLIDEIVPAGYKTIEWDSRNNAGNTVASGVYFYRIDAVSITQPARMFGQVKKSLLLK
jgi:hypothetical protein